LTLNPLSKSIASYFPFYYGWVIVGVSLITTTAAYGIWWSFPVYYVNILKEFGWSRASTATIFTVGLVVYGLGSFPAGILVDRLGPRKLLPLACLTLASGCLICSAASQKWHFYIAYGVFMGLGTICMGYVPVTALVSNWFIRRRGTAIGIALIGNVAPPLLALPIQKLISLIGWRASYVVLAGVLLAAIIPLTAFFMRTRPQDLGLNPDGRPAEWRPPEAGKRTGGEPGGQLIMNQEWAATKWNLHNGLKTHQFWALNGVMITLGTGAGMIMHHLVALVVDMGYSRDMAAFIFSLAGMMAVVGRLSGYLSDRFGREITYAFVSSLYLCSALSLFLFLTHPQVWLLYLYALTFGLGSGLGSPTLSAGAADLFGGKSFGTILGFSNIFFGLGHGIGAWAGGAIFDHTGSYGLAMILALPLFSLMCFLFWVVGPRRVRRIVNPR
jgi:MFS family permease